MAISKNDIKAFLPDGKPESHWNFALRMFRPLVRILLRFGFSCDDMTQIIRKIAVDTALEQQEFKTRDKPFTAHASVVTGLSRKEVRRLREQDDVRELVDARHGNRATRVLDGWMNDPRYKDSDGRPRASLPLNSSRGVSFHQLVREYGGDVPTRAVLSALLDHGAVSEDEKGQIALIRGYYVPENDSTELEDNIALVLGDAMATAEFNLRIGQQRTRFLREWFQRYVPADLASEAHRLVREEALAFGERMDARLAELAHSRPLHGEKYRRVGMGIFFSES